MKELVQVLSRVTGKQYSSVNNERNEPARSRKHDIDTSTFEANLSECEELNQKFNDNIDFNDRKDAIINRLFIRRRSHQATKKSQCLFILLVLGFLSLGVGIGIMFLHPYDRIFDWKITLGDGGEIYEMWRKPEVKLYTRVFLFNITNAEEYMSGQDTKLKVAEVGPYVYREMLEHSNVTFNENGTLSTIPRHPLVWDAELSEGHTEDEILYLPHIALLSIAHVTAKKNFVTRFGLNNLIRLTNSQPLLKMTAKEFMMGHKSELMALGHSFMPGWIYFDKLGLIDRMYDFDGDYATVFTGETDVTKSGLIDTYRGSTDLPQWHGKHCSNVQNASDGTKFKGKIGKNESITFFRKSLCRAAPLVKVDEGVKHGMNAYKFTFPDHMMDNGKFHEENKCFCRDGNCLPEGLLDVADCYYGFPIALSYPHFYKGDNILFEKVEGMEPDEKKHETRFWINPESGLPLDISAKIQINMALGDLRNIEHSSKFSDMYLPMLWFDIRLFSLTPSIEQRCKLYLNILPVAEQVLMYFSLIAGVILITTIAYIFSFKVVFKTNKDLQCRLNFKSNIWMEREKQSVQRPKNDIYSPCEVSVDSTDSEQETKTFMKTQTDRFKVLSHMISDKMHDSVGNVKGRFEEFTHNKQNNARKNSLINPDDSQDETNEAYRSDSGEDSDKDSDKYRARKDEACKYLEVIDDGSEFES